MVTQRRVPPFDNRLQALNGVLHQRPEEDSGQTLTVQTVIFNSFFTVIGVNKCGCISVGILCMLSDSYNNVTSLSVAKTCGLLWHASLLHRMAHLVEKEKCITIQSSCLHEVIIHKRPDLWRTKENIVPIHGILDRFWSGIIKCSVLSACWRGQVCSCRVDWRTGKWTAEELLSFSLRLAVLSKHTTLHVTP